MWFFKKVEICWQIIEQHQTHKAKRRKKNEVIIRNQQVSNILKGQHYISSI